MRPHPTHRPTLSESWSEENIIKKCGKNDPPVTYTGYTALVIMSHLSSVRTAAGVAGRPGPRRGTPEETIKVAKIM